MPLTKDGGGSGGGDGNYRSTLPSTVINQIGPFTTMRWNQENPYHDGPYNSKMPMSNACGQGSAKAPAGCVTVAVAQILGHIKPVLLLPNYTNSGSFMLNWNVFNTSPDINWISQGDPGFHEMGSLMRWTADQLGSFQTCTEGSVTTVANGAVAVNFLKNYININHYLNFSTSQIKHSLDNLKIVYATGDRLIANNGKVGHAWVVDGYAVCKKGKRNGNNGSNDIVNRYDMYLHANMGWGEEDGTGWYLVNNDWSVVFDTGWSAPNPNDVGRRNFRFNLRSATHAGPK